MKKLVLLALALTIGTSTLFANNVNFDKPSKEIRNQIAAIMDTPTFSVNSDITVNISFTFNSAGEIIVLNVDSKNKNVLNYIRKNLNQKAISNPGEKDQLYTMPLTLKKG